MNEVSLRSFVILVVCGNREVLEVIERLFGYLKVNVTCVTNSDAALVRLRTETYSAMISDYKMKDFHGHDFRRTVREQFPALNIVLFAGTTTSQIMDLFLDPKVSELSGGQYRPSSLGNLWEAIEQDKEGKTYLLEPTI